MQNGYFLFWSVDDMNNDITDTWFKQCPKCITSLLWNIKNSFVVLHSERSLVPVIRKTVYQFNSPLVCLKVCKQTLRTETFAPGVNFSVDSSGSFEENRSCRCCCFCFFLPSLTLSGSYKLTWAVAAFGKTRTRSVMHKMAFQLRQFIVITLSQFSVIGVKVLFLVIIASCHFSREVVLAVEWHFG